MNTNWYVVENIEQIDSPSVLLYEDRLSRNLTKIVSLADRDVSRVMPHIKTNKMPKVIERMLSFGLSRFKSSTIAEAEMAAEVGAKEVLVAHQLVGPKIQRFGTLVSQFSETHFSTLTDNIDSLRRLEREAKEKKVKFSVFIDVNTGMNRSGIEPGPSMNDLIELIVASEYLIFEGFHAYDGHLRDKEYTVRKDKVEQGVAPLTRVYKEFKKKYPMIRLICGGTPSFTSHIMEDGRVCSPGTCVLWDWGYSEKLTEQTFEYAALLVTRVISKPTQGIITVDLGHKAVASENPIDKRVKFLNLEQYELISQSEEHGVIKIKNWDTIHVGDVLYGVPYHICPTINLYDDVSVISNRRKIDEWQILARKRKITI
jgi:D-serine deaminase-like pyridoxal phosphate-dependent protein